jgi:fructose-1,6-bisphosphatase/inositol monophosphatase family enzyme
VINIDVQEIIRIVEGAGAIIRGNFGKAAEISEKTGAHNIATETDKASENYILGELARVMPDINIYAEESGISNPYDLEDYVAGKLIVREASGKITDFAGNELTDDRVGVFVASNGTALHQQVLSIV